MVPESINAVLKLIDSETNGLATLVTTLRGLVKTGMTAEDVAVVNGNLDALAVRLKGIAADPETPIPEEPPVVFSRSRKG